MKKARKMKKPVGQLCQREVLAKTHQPFVGVLEEREKEREREREWLWQRKERPLVFPRKGKAW